MSRDSQAHAATAPPTPQPSLMTPAEHARVADAIQAAEAETSGEIFAVVTRASDGYRFIPLLWGALFALLGGVVTTVLWPFVALLFGGATGEAGGWSGWDVGPESLTALSLALGQLVVFLAFALLTLSPAWRVRLVPRGVREGRCRRHATEQFLAHNLHVTKDRTGVLIFVSMAERYATILADEGIAAHVDDSVWMAIVESLIERVAAGDLAGGLETAVAACGQVLAEHAPPSGAQENELPDHVVEL